LPEKTAKAIALADAVGQTAMRGGTSKAIERYETDLIAMDPLTGTIKGKAHNPYPNIAGRCDLRRPGVHRIHRRNARGL
jgi:hypothetical protein